MHRIIHFKTKQISMLPLLLRYQAAFQMEKTVEKKVIKDGHKTMNF